jgi:hypothetical protein
VQADQRTDEEQFQPLPSRKPWELGHADQRTDEEYILPFPSREPWDRHTIELEKIIPTTSPYRTLGKTDQRTGKE